MSSLTAIFGGSGGERAQDSEKLLHLYWNRAELKKQFAGMRKEQFRLQDRIKQQEGSTARLQQKLDHLESLLLDPEWIGNVVVFYQLRGLAIRCQYKLSKFAEQLKQQREQRLHNSLLVKWNEERTSESKAVGRELVQLRDNIERVERQLEAERDRLMSMSGFLKIFRRRSITALLENLGKEVEAAHAREQSLLCELDAIRSRQPPENQGLDAQSKRSINLMILAFAQQLLLMFDDDELAAMAKEASERSVGAINYGTWRDCEQMLARIRKRSEKLEQPGDFATVLQQRAKLIGEGALFRNDSDPVPVAGSVSTVFDIAENGTVRKTEANVLGENYWGVAKVLSR